MFCAPKSCSSALLLAVLAACAPPPQALPLTARAAAFALPQIEERDPGARGLPVKATPTPPPAAMPPLQPTPTPQAVDQAAGHGGTGGGFVPPASTAQPAGYLYVNGKTVPLTSVGAEVAVPADAASLTLVGDALVPSSLELAGLTPPPFTHPRPTLVTAPAGGPARLTGTLGAGMAGGHLRWVTAERQASADLDAATGSAFQLDLPLASGAPGLLVAVDGAGPPALAVRALSPAAGDDTDLGTLAFTPPGPDQPTPPAPPAGLVADTAELRLVGPDATLPVFATRGGALPSYALPGATWEVGYGAISPDGRQAAWVAGPPGAVPAFLTPPDLTGLPASLEAGTRLSWPAVPGATLYTLTITREGEPDPPLWEAAAAAPAVTVPTLAGGAHDVRLRVVAWDAPAVTIYSVASLRRLRLPAESAGAPTGRRSATTRRYS